MAETSLAGIRRFKTEDIDAILEIEAVAFPKTAYPREVFLDYAEKDPDGFLVLEIEGAVEGYIISDTGGHIHSMAISPQYRRKGLGKMLFMHAVKYAKEKLWLEVRAENRTAIRFYERLGMRIIGRIPNYYETDDALVMALNQKEQRSKPID